MLISCTWCFAQTPKWIEKAKNAVFSIISYDAEGNILHSGNGFFINEGGEALSDYAVFEGAQKAVVITPDGNKQEVSTIIGANEMYDIVHFKVKLNINPKKLVSLPVYTEERTYRYIEKGRALVNQEKKSHQKLTHSDLDLGFLACTTVRK